MEGARILRSSQIIILGVCIAVATIASSVILSKGFLQVTKFVKEQITVTGSAQNQIRSDYIVWNCTFSVRDVDLSSSYRRLNDDLAKVKEYLISKGLTDQEMFLTQIAINKIYKKNERGNDTNDIQWYQLIQTIQIKSTDVLKVDRISREVTGLINAGIELESSAPEYFYTKLDELKIQMLASAASNAKARAESMVRATGAKVGPMRSARMGVFQITPLTSTDVSDWGVNDTTSLDKKVMAVVTASFSIE